MEYFWARKLMGPLLRWPNSWKFFEVSFYY